MKSGLAAGATCAAPLFLPSPGFGNSSRPSAGNRITIGMNGTGRQSAYANIPGFLLEPAAQIVAVCDVVSWRLA